MPVTYSEVRQWIYWLRLFTASDLADAMGVPYEVADQFMFAAEIHGIIENTGDLVNGREWGDEEIYSYVPLPPGPTRAFTHIPEWRTTPGVYDLAPFRGMPIRIRSSEDARRHGSLPGQGHRWRLAEKRYAKMQEARAERAEKQKIKQQHMEAEGKWRKVKRKK
jgi:hypothetical protein